MGGDWIQAEIFTSTAGLEPLGAALSDIGYPSFAVRDAADFENFLAGNSGRWDYIDDGLMPLREAETAVTVYLPDNKQGAEGLAALRDMLKRLKVLDTDGEWGRLEYSLSGVKEEDWALAWKKYYKPVRIGRGLVICPSWEDYFAKPGDTIVRLDPGMAFGTGSHESTKLCLEALEGIVSGGKRVLDIGCGSGILSVAALLLGAESAVGVDIDETAVRVSSENAEMNGVGDRAEFIRGDLTDAVSGRFDIVCANIVADVIIRLFESVSGYMADSGHFLVSGIISERSEEVLGAAIERGFTLVSRKEDNGWTAMLLLGR